MPSIKFPDSNAIYSPVGLKEAALDSPTFRATVVHFGEQIDIIEKWLDNYIRSASRLANEVSGIESIINTYLSWATPPAQVSEAILDHDYTALAMKRYNEGAKEFWSSTLKWMKRVESTVVDPIKAFMHTELAGLKVRGMDCIQVNYADVHHRARDETSSKVSATLILRSPDTPPNPKRKSRLRYERMLSNYTRRGRLTSRLRWISVRSPHKHGTRSTNYSSRYFPTDGGT